MPKSYRIAGYFRVATAEQISDCPSNGTPVRLPSNHEGKKSPSPKADLPLKEDKK